MKDLHDKARLKHELTVAVQHLLESQKKFFGKFCEDLIQTIQH